MTNRRRKTCNDKGHAWHLVNPGKPLTCNRCGATAEVVPDDTHNTYGPTPPEVDHTTGVITYDANSR